MLQNVLHWLQRSTTQLGLGWLASSLGLVAFLNPTGETLPLAAQGNKLLEAYVGYAIALGGVVVWALVRTIKRREPQIIRSDDSVLRRVDLKLRAIGDAVADLRRDGNRTYAQLVEVRQEVSEVRKESSEVRERLASVEATLRHLPCERGGKKDC